MVATLVRRTAKELAGSFYEGADVLADGRVERTQRFRQAYPKQQDFVRQQWPSFVKVAREILAHILTEPGTSQGDKNAIYDALLNDRGRLNDEQLIAPSIMRLN